MRLHFDMPRATNKLGEDWWLDAVKRPMGAYYRISPENIRDLTQKITNVVEKYVRLYPEQWLWIHKRWNTRPKGEKGLY